MIPKPKIVPVLYCSFCGKSQHEVRKLIAGPTVFICDECVTLCQGIVAEIDADSRLRKDMRERGEIIVSATDAALIAWMKTGEFAPGDAPEQEERDGHG